MARFLTPSAAVVALLRQCGGVTEVLLQRRKNTGFADGMWDLSCSGHVEQGESMLCAAMRECFEELGVTVSKQNLRFFAFLHKKDGEVIYYNAYFVAQNFEGQPHICENAKCSELAWFDIKNLPDDLLSDRKLALQYIFDQPQYLEYGWND